ncbi:MAG: HD domain-containing protein [Actinomycetales bacterium]|nr:HD domain-containing protein [Actinomycetales bacterium]
MSTTPHVTLGARYFDAVAFSSLLHAEQVRKGKTTAYICHPLAVSALVLEAEGDEDQAIAGLLHDTAEDCGGEPILRQIRWRYGNRVAAAVEGCSDSLAADPTQKAPWKERKEGHLRHLATAGPDVLIVTAADKLHNARAIWADVQARGPSSLRVFNHPKEIAWYYQATLDTLTAAGAPTLLTSQLAEVAIPLIDWLKSNPLPEGAAAKA